MRNNKQQKARSNYLFPKNSHVKKDKCIKLTPIKELTQKETLLLPTEKCKSPEMAYAPQKLSSAITARLKGTNQNANKFRTSFIGLISTSKIKNVRPIYINSESLLNRIQKTNQQKISNLLNFRKRKSHSQCTISVAYQNLLPNSKFTRPSQATRQILRLTKIRELFNSMEDQSSERAKVVEQYSHLVIHPQKLTIKKGERYTRSVCRTEADDCNLTQLEQKRNECIVRAERVKRLKIRPIQVRNMKIPNDQKRQTFYEIGGWNITNNQNQRSDLEDLLYQSYSSKKLENEQQIKTMRTCKQKWESQYPIHEKVKYIENGDNAFFVTRTNTNLE